ncbi:MAG: ABC transporter substrate-binding protein [Chloroflexota bacterium]|nr:ABC transporter substrate-binding protein [Chloroflexota bacterium]
MSIRLRAVWMLAAALLSVSLAACGAAPGEPLKIGLLTYISEGSPQNAQDRQRAFDLAVAHLNQAGGVFGRPVETAVGDTALDPETAVVEARRLIEDEGVHALVGPSTSANSLAVIERVAGPAGIPVVSPSATSPRLTDAADDDFFFRAALSDVAQGPVLAQVARDRGFDNVGVIYRNDAWGQGLVQSFQDAWEGAVTAVAVEPDQTTFADALRQSAAGGAQALILIVFSTETEIILREALGQGIYEQFVFSDGVKSPALVQAIGGAALGGMYGTGPASPPASESAARWEAAFVDVYGEPPAGSYAQEAYDATIALALAAETAGSADGSAIRDQLRAVGGGPGEVVYAGPEGIARALEILGAGDAVDYDGASGTLDWDANGDLSRGYIGIWRYTTDERIEEVDVVLFEN